MVWSKDMSISFLKQILDSNSLNYTEPQAEDESSEYKAHFFKIENKSVRYRMAKITPTKIGQFVTIWKRNSNKITCPYDSSDKIDFLMVAVEFKKKSGLFIFPKKALIREGILSVDATGGKRAFRVYPSWDKPESKQATKSQTWQLEFFVETPTDKAIDTKRIKSLYNFSI